MTTFELGTERPIFVAADGRRARRLRYAGAAVVLLGCLWLVALAVGMLGFGHLPELSLPGVGRASPEPGDATVPRSSPVSRDLAGATSVSQATVAASPATKALRSTRSSRATRAAEVTRPNRPRTVPRSTAPVQAVQPPVETPAAVPARQGWARKDWTAPPGQSRQAEPGPPATSPGQAQRQARAAETTTPTTSTTPETAPLPPGQQKKPDEPTP